MRAEPTGGMTRLALGAAVGLILGIGLGGLLSGGDRSDTVAGGGATASSGGEQLARELKAIRLELEELRRGVSASSRMRPAANTPAPAESSRRNPVVASAADEPLEAWRAALAELEEILRGELHLLREELLQTEPSKRRRDIDWEAWRTLYGTYLRTPEEAVKEVKMLTTREVLARFGPPAHAREKDGRGTHWYYYDETPGGEVLSVVLEIVDGYVMQLWMEP